MASSNAACSSETKSLWMLPSGNYLLCIALTAARVIGKTGQWKNTSLFTCYSDGHGGVPVRYSMHHSMENVDGFTRSHWMPPLGKYLLQ
jgi:hypothetical protein